MSAVRTIDPRDRLIFAMDVPDPAQARRLAETLGDAVRFYKLGLEMMMSGGYFEFADWLTARGRQVFADLKFFDIPATVGAAVRQLAKRDVAFATVHGNQGIMEAAAEAKGDVKILAVTVLTSFDSRDLDELGQAGDVTELVISRARRALDAGCDGVIASGLELAALRRAVDRRLLIVTPGIRPAEGRAPDDQKRVVTVEQAFRDGADHIVVGRPIRDARDPRRAAEAIQATIARIFSV